MPRRWQEQRRSSLVNLNGGAGITRPRLPRLTRQEPHWPWQTRHSQSTRGGERLGWHPGGTSRGLASHCPITMLKWDGHVDSCDGLYPGSRFFFFFCLTVADLFIWACTGWSQQRQGALTSIPSADMSRHVQHYLGSEFDCRWDNTALVSLFEQSERGVCDAACECECLYRSLYNNYMCERSV